LSDGDEIGETMIHDIALFLTHPKYPKNQILQELRIDVKAVTGHEDLLVCLLELCQVSPRL
jgi:hypothetical protein